LLAFESKGEEDGSKSQVSLACKARLEGPLPIDSSFFLIVLACGLKW